MQAWDQLHHAVHGLKKGQSHISPHESRGAEERMTLRFVVGVALTARIDINSSLILAVVRVCGDSKIPLSRPDCTRASQCTGIYACDSSETYEITTRYSLRAFAIGHILSALRYGLLDIGMFRKRQGISYIFTPARVAPFFPEAFRRVRASFLSLNLGVGAARFTPKQTSRTDRSPNFLKSGLLNFFTCGNL